MTPPTPDDLELEDPVQCCDECCASMERERCVLALFTDATWAIYCRPCYTDLNPEGIERTYAL